MCCARTARLYSYRSVGDSRYAHETDAAVLSRETRRHRAPHKTHEPDAEPRQAIGHRAIRDETSIRNENRARRYETSQSSSTAPALNQTPLYDRSEDNSQAALADRQTARNASP